MPSRPGLPRIGPTGYQSTCGWLRPGPGCSASHALAVVRMVLERLVFLYGWHAGNNV